MRTPGERSAPTIRVSVEGSEPDGSLVHQRFTSTFRIGRSEECDVQLTDPFVSRIHAEVSFVDGCWWVRDLQSTHGTYIDGHPIDTVRLDRAAEIRIGKTGPLIRLTPEDEAHAPLVSPLSATLSSSSLDDYIKHYLNTAADPDAGEHTLMIRRAFATVHTKQRRRYTWLGIGALVVVLAFAAYVLVQHSQIGRQQFEITWQELQLRRQQEAATKFFYEMKALDLQIVQLRTMLEETKNTKLSDQLQALEESRQRMSTRYDGYVEELGVSRKLTDQEKVIYKVARVFNESEFEMPAAFVTAVQAMIHNYWLSRAGQERFLRGVQKADKAGYTPYIVHTLQHYGLPPQLFYMALQESNLNPKAVGPLTRWGRAKGMWQFIPETARRFGLFPGPSADAQIIEPTDERLDYRKATDAAARYLRTVYSTLAQASGLLVVASYNWGEHRIADKLERLTGPQTIPKEALEGIPEDPTARTYWHFLGEYRNRMPDETKDYVLKIFAAAVLGEDPRRFGWDIDNPLARYTEGSQSPP